MDKLMHQQSTLIAVALKVQQIQNSKNLEKRYKNYKGTPRLHPTRYGEEPSPKIPNHIVTHPIFGIAGNNESLTVSSLNISSDTNHNTHNVTIHTIHLSRCMIGHGIHHSTHHVTSNQKTLIVRQQLWWSLTWTHTN
jgi:hypothetical protein